MDAAALRSCVTPTRFAHGGRTDRRRNRGGVADPTAPTLKLSAASAALVLCWPHEFPGYRLQSSTNLGLTNWADLALSGSNVLITAGNLPQQYFRLVKP